MSIAHLDLPLQHTIKDLHSTLLSTGIPQPKTRMTYLLVAGTTALTIEGPVESTTIDLSDRSDSRVKGVGGFQMLSRDYRVQASRNMAAEICGEHSGMMRI